MKVKQIQFFGGFKIEGSHCICLSVILIDSIFNVFLEEC